MNKIFSMSAIALAVALAGCESSDDDEPEIDTGGGTTVNTAATFGGDQTGSATREDTDAVTGALTITDPDDGEASVVAQTDSAGDYGTFTIAADGTWSYTLDTTNSTISSLANEEDSVTDTFNVASADGTVTQIAITIVGVPADQIAKISDSVDSDTGELYYEFENGSTTGKISLSILYDTNETETAYISLYDAEGSTKTVIGELSLNEGKFGLRENTFTDPSAPTKDSSASSSINETDAISAPDFVPGEWVDIELTWDTSSTTDVGTYSVMIDGESYGPFTSQHPTPGVLVESMTVRLSSNGSLSSDAIYVNDLNIYSDVAGTMPILEQNFDDGYTAGDLLDDSNDDSPFGSRTFEAKVVVYGQDDSDDTDTGSSDNVEVFMSTAADVAPGTTGNKVASIVDTLSSDAGELRLKLATDNRIVKGRMTASFSKTDAASCTVGSDVKDAYIGVHGTPSGTYDAIVDLRIDGTDYPTDFAIRKNNVSGDKTVDIDTTVAAFTANTWTDVEISWDATVVDASTGPLVSVSINDTPVADAWNSHSESAAGLSDGAHYFTFRLGDTNAQMASCNFTVDNIKIYSEDTSGSETMLFGENFEDYSDGLDLATATLADGTTLLYNSATNEAVVASEQ